MTDGIWLAFWLALGLGGPVEGLLPSEQAVHETGQEPPSLVLLTLDTTRSDYLGCYGATAARTPNLDALAAGGTRYARALTPSPLTLPAHASLLTGLDPPEHGLRDNGLDALGTDLPTLATVLSGAGYATGAFIASRVLDRRFGLDRGFDIYDDRMAAERLGQYGYPERDAGAVTSAALAWLSRLPASRPYFLWVHYYDPHAPYLPPSRWRGASEKENYAGEIGYMDQEIGRLLAGLPEQGRPPIVAAVGDHGEALGEHGEAGHGIFLYRAALEAPLLLSGQGIPAGRVVEQAVSTRRLGPTLLHLVGTGRSLLPDKEILPGLPGLGSQSSTQPIYSETWMPASAYGWAPLQALSDQRWRLIVAPRPELYDYLADPGETRNLLRQEVGQARRLRAALQAYEAGLERRQTQKLENDPELAADLRSLGYLSGSSDRQGTIDPKDGVAMLAELERAKELTRGRNFIQAIPILQDLARRNPENVPFLTHLGGALLESGQGEAALRIYQQTVELAPGLDFVQQHLADAYLRLGRAPEARQAYRRTLELNPRSASAWLKLAELELRSGRPDEERRLLLQAVEEGTSSAMIHSRLGQIEAAAGQAAAADSHFEAATRLTPEWVLVWLLWGDFAERRGQHEAAATRYAQAVRTEPGNAGAYLRLGRVSLELGRTAEALRYLRQAAALAPGSPEAREARRLLAQAEQKK